LNKRGKRDAPFMGKLLKKKKIIPDMIYTSPAVRALTTAEIFAGELGIPKNKTVKEKNIYDSGIKGMEETVQNIPDEFSTAFLFGHNPAITYYANHLGDKAVNMPTCSIVGIEFEVDSWKEVERGKGQVILFEYPKKYSGK
jgi:phosphohistidine phosphatase